MQKCRAISLGLVGEAEMTEAAGSDKSERLTQGRASAAPGCSSSDGNQLQRKTGPHFLSPHSQRTLFSRRGEERASFKDGAKLTPRVHACP